MKEVKKIFANLHKKLYNNNATCWKTPRNCNKEVTLW